MVFRGSCGPYAGVAVGVGCVSSAYDGRGRARRGLGLASSPLTLPATEAGCGDSPLHEVKYEPSTFSALETVIASALKNRRLRCYGID